MRFLHILGLDTGSFAAIVNLSAPAVLTVRRITRQSAGSFHRTADFETYGQDEHYAAGISEIFGMMAEHMRCRADVDRP